MSATPHDDSAAVPVPGTFQFRLLRSEAADRIPPLDDWRLQEQLHESFTRFGRHAVLGAQVEVVRRHHAALDTPHLLLSIVALVPATLLFGPDGPSRSLLTAALESAFERSALPEPFELETIPVTDAVRRVFERAREEADKRGYDRVGTGPLLLGLVQEEKPSASREVLEQHGITYQSLCANLSPDAFTL